MRALLVLTVPLLLAGCADDPPAPSEPAATPEDACEARGIGDRSCGTFCALHPVACGIPAPSAVPYPTLPAFPLPTPTLPAGMPALNGTTPPVLPTLPGPLPLP